jgi:hypothetical protein
MKELILFCCLMFASFYAKAFVVYGNGVPVGQGMAQAYADIDQNGTVMSVGIAMTEEAMQGLPEHDMSQYILKLPSVLNIPNYDHMMVDWNPHGHEPEPIYGAAHFDFHFYLISEAERQAITCQGDDEAACLAQPDPTKLPPFYIPTPAGVPQMGWHWLDPRSPEFNGQPFTATFIYGFYGGNMAFLEPMITRDYLMKKPCVEKDIPVPQVFPRAGSYPQSYSISFDQGLKMYFIALKNMVHHD